MNKQNKRCNWANKEILIEYHDNEWCKPNYDDKYIFEMLILECMQAGLSWLTILLRRENYRSALDNFNLEIIAKYNSSKIDQLLNNESLIRNKLKINSIVTNAQSFIQVQKEHGSFKNYIWSFVNDKQIVNRWESQNDLPAQTDLSVKISKDLKKQGFKFVGPTIVYSFLQSIGIIDDHIKTCFKSN